MISKEEIERFQILYKQKDLTPKEKIELEELYQKHKEARDELIVSLMKDSIRLELGCNLLESDTTFSKDQLMDIMKRTIILNGFITAALTGMITGEFVTKTNTDTETEDKFFETMNQDVKLH